MFSLLRKHAVLLHSLEHPTDQSTWSHTDVQSSAAAEHCSWKVATALAAAAAALPGGLVLRCLHTYSLPVLSAASCSTLTSLPPVPGSREPVFKRGDGSSCQLHPRAEQPPEHPLLASL